MFTAFSLSGLVWLLAALTGVTLVVVFTARNARPTKTIASVLYETEHSERTR